MRTTPSSTSASRDVAEADARGRFPAHARRASFVRVRRKRQAQGEPRAIHRRGFQRVHQQHGRHRGGSAEAAEALAARANAGRGDADASDMASRASRASSAAGIDPATRTPSRSCLTLRETTCEIIVEEAVRAAGCVDAGRGVGVVARVGAPGLRRRSRKVLVAPPLAFVPGLNLPLALREPARRAKRRRGVADARGPGEEFGAASSVAEAASPEVAARLRRNGDGAGRGVAGATNATSATEFGGGLPIGEIRRVARAVVAEVGPAVVLARHRPVANSPPN